MGTAVHVAALVSDAAGGQPVASDFDLVAAARAGSRDAFGQLVERYKGLVFSLAYSSTANLALSEDIAQESFVEAWKSLGQLREPARFRSWICRITRRLGDHASRREKRLFEPVPDPVAQAAVDRASAEPSPLDHLITREEEVLARRALARLSEDYREPLILYYREGRSIEKVAQALDLTEENVQKRLYRARRMLHERLLAAVESAVRRRPIRPDFTAGVIAAMALPAANSRASAETPGFGGGRSRVPRIPSVKATAGAALTLVVVGSLYLRPTHGTRSDSPRRPPTLTAAASPPRLELNALNRPSLETWVQTGSSWTPRARRKILDLDFEDGLVPKAALAGQTIPCPPGNGDGYCLSAEVFPTTRSRYIEIDFSGGEQPLFTFSRNQVLSFDYWMAREARLVVQFSRLDQGQYNRDVEHPVAGAWGHADIPVRLAAAAHGLPLQDGQAIHALYICTERLSDQALYIDNVTVSDL